MLIVISFVEQMITVNRSIGVNGVVQIDLNKVKSEVLDVSNGFDQKGMISNWAKKDKEVLIKKQFLLKLLKH